MGWMKLPEPQPSEDSCHCSAASCRGPNAAVCSTCVARCMYFFFFLSCFFSCFFFYFFSSSLLSFLVTRLRAHVVLRAERQFPGTRASSRSPGWPTCRRHTVSTTWKASLCHLAAREAPHGVVGARIVSPCPSAHQGVQKGTKPGINSNNIKRDKKKSPPPCASISPATAKLASPPRRACLLADVTGR